MMNQIYFYNTQAILLITLQANWRNYAKWFFYPEVKIKPPHSEIAFR